MPQTPSRCGSQATLKAAVTSLRWRHPHRRSRHRTAGRLLAGGALGVGGCSPIGVDAARASRCHHPRDEVRRAQTAPARHSFCGDAPPSTDPIAPGTVRVQRARSGKEKRVGAKRRPARVEPVNPRCVGPVRIAAAAREILPQRDLAETAPIGTAPRLSSRRRKSRRCGSPDGPWRRRWRRRASP